MNPPTPTPTAPNPPAKLLTPAAISRYQAAPVSFASDRILLVAMADPATGAIVGFIVVAMYMPLFKVYDAIK